MSITINSPATAIDLYTLLMKGSASGYVCNPVTGINPNDPIGTVSGHCSYLSIQADPSNAAASLIYVGDSRVSATCKGKALGVGVIDERSADFNVSHLREIFLLASAAGLIANIEVHFE